MTRVGFLKAASVFVRLRYSYNQKVHSHLLFLCSCCTAGAPTLLNLTPWSSWWSDFLARAFFVMTCVSLSRGWRRNHFLDLKQMMFIETEAADCGGGLLLCLWLDLKWPLIFCRIGRSGRYGRKGVAINFVKNDDIRILRDIEQYYSTQIDEMPMNGMSPPITHLQPLTSRCRTNQNVCACSHPAHQNLLLMSQE